MKQIKKLYEIDGQKYVMEFSWKDQPEDYIRDDLAPDHPMRIASEREALADRAKMALGEPYDHENPTWIDVKCVEVQHYGDDEVWFHREGESCTGAKQYSTQDFAKAESLFDVSVKWDQCAHWRMGYIHTCGDHLTLLDAMNTAYNEAKKIMQEAGSWDE
jgi:hypothetical protein